MMIEVIINPSGGATVAQTPFLEQQQLLNRPIVAIEAFCSQDFAYSPLSSGIAVVPPLIFNASFLQLMRAGEETAHGKEGQKAGLWYKNIPMPVLRRVQNGYTGATPSASFTRDLFRVKPMFLQWPDSLIVIPTSQTQAAPYSFPFLVHFLLKGEDTRPYMYNLG